MRSLLSLALVVTFFLGSPSSAEAQHKHVAPHGGTLVVLGDHFAHLEVALDPAQGELRVWVLDGEAESPISLPQATIQLKVRHLKDAAGKMKHRESFTLTARATANPLTGETASRSSEFRVSHPDLKGTARFEALVKEMEVRGVPVRAFGFPFPEGNEKKEKNANP